MTAPKGVTISGNKTRRYDENKDENFGNEKDDAWRSEIHEGKILDVMDRSKKWCEAEVEKIFKSRLPIMLKFRMIPAYAARHDRGDLDQLFSIDSNLVQKRYTHTFAEGSEPKVGQRVELRLQMDEWKEAIVVDKREGKVELEYVNENRKLMKKMIEPGKNTIRPPTEKPQEICPIENDENRFRRNNAGYHDYSETKRPDKKPYQPPGQKRAALSDRHTRAIDVSSQRYRRYQDALSRHGLAIYPIRGDGNCLFRSVSHQIYGDDRYHQLVRLKCMEYMESEREFFQSYVEGGSDGFSAYLDWKRQDAVWGDDPEVQAFCEIYECTAEIWSFDIRDGAKMLRTFHENATDSSSQRSIMLSYYGGGHYDSIVLQNLNERLLNRGLYHSVIPGIIEDRAIFQSRNRKKPRDSIPISNINEKIESESGVKIMDEDQMLRLGRSQFETYSAKLDEDLALTMLMDEEQAKEGELLSLQDYIDTTTQQISEREHIEAALEESIIMNTLKESEQQRNKDEVNNLDIGTSSGLTDDEQEELMKAIEMSMESAQRENADHSCEGSASNMMTDGIDEERFLEELRAAKEESLRHQSAGSHSTTPTAFLAIFIEHTASAENGERLSDADRAKLLESVQRSLEYQLAGRASDALDAMEESRKHQDGVRFFKEKLKESEISTFELTRDMTRQYKGMQEELIDRINKLEGIIQTLNDRVESDRLELEQTKLEKEAIIKAKDREIALGKIRMDEMADEFSTMLKDTLKKMHQHLDIDQIDQADDDSLPIRQLIDDISYDRNVDLPSRNTLR